MQKYYIYCRYEFISNEGKEFSNWFKVGKSHLDEKSAKEELNNIKSTSKDIDKHTKLKHEYEIRYLDETLIPQARMRRPKGRPKKITTEELRVFVKALDNKGSIKVDEAIKEYLYNDEEAYKYIQEHIKEKDTKWVRYWYDENDILYILLKDNTEKLYD